MVEDHEHFASAQATPKEQIMSARPKSRTAAVNGRRWGARARNWAAPRASPLPGCASSSPSSMTCSKPSSASGMEQELLKVVRSHDCHGDEKQSGVSPTLHRRPDQISDEALVTLLSADWLPHFPFSSRAAGVTGRRSPRRSSRTGRPLRTRSAAKAMVARPSSDANGVFRNCGSRRVHPRG
ncbi:hypothetical protein C7476_12326 [Phyllobacterium bourgognense]|uniref:Uncharacterized protein n=1 Tax=Phyllobacterium bourgognense TaxID=314236 RepID=A0A368YIA4_9HYPH|nr:hypothetical protein C7476_12326 [Phyllobacterium bourgognense]